MLDSPQFPVHHRILWTIAERDTESTPSTRSSYRSSQVGAETAIERSRNSADHFTQAQNVAVDRAMPAIRTRSGDITDRLTRASHRLSQAVIPVGQFSAWTRFRTMFISCSPKLLQHRLPQDATQATKENAGVAAVLLKTIAVLANAHVHKLGNVNAVFTHDERWLGDNLQASARFFETLAEDHGYAQKSKNSAKRFLYESGARALRHLTALDHDQRIVEKQTSQFQTTSL